MEAMGLKWNLMAVLRGLIIFVVASGISYYLIDEFDLAQNKAIWWFSAASAVAVLFIPVFFWQLVLAPVRIHREQQDEIKRLNEQINRKGFFQCDKATAARLLTLLATVLDDATNYQGYAESHTNRLDELDAEKGVFLESEFSGAFHIFYNRANALICSKQDPENALALTHEEKNTAIEDIKISHGILRSALRHDINQTSPAKEPA